MHTQICLVIFTIISHSNKIMNGEGIPSPFLLFKLPLPFGTTVLLVNPSVNGFEGFIFHFWTVAVPDFTLERMVA